MKKSTALLSLAAAVGLAVANADAAVTLKIRNFSGQQVWVQWMGMPSTGLTGTTGGMTIQPSDFGSNASGYDLSTFTSPTANEYEITNYSMSGGRIMFTYGATPISIPSAGKQPSLSNFNDPNFLKRFDKIEGAITGSTDDNINMTALDGFSIPFNVAGYQAANQATTLQTLHSQMGRRVYTPLAAIAANKSASAAPITPSGASPALPTITGNSPYLVVNASSQGVVPAAGYTGYQYSPIGQTGPFVRVMGNDNIVGYYNQPNPGGTAFTDPVAIANGTVTAPAVPANYTWKTYDAYVKLLDGRAGSSSYTGTTTIAGLYSGLKTPTDATTTQSHYNLTATFSPTEQRTLTYTATGVPTVQIQFTGFVTLSGTVTIASGGYAGTYATEIKIPYGGLSQYYTMLQGTYQTAFMLDPTGVVGSNANYIYKFYQTSPVAQPDPGWSQTNPLVGGPGNNVLTQAVGDLFAGMNLGSAGSTATLGTAVTINGNSYASTQVVGAMPSQDWFGIGAALAAATGTGSVYDYYFGKLQSSSLYYNEYAEALYPLSDAYGFAYSDRVQGGTVAVSWDATKATAIDTIVITILPDEIGPRLTGSRVEAIEYKNDALGDYFVTWMPDEIAKLDSGAIKGWARTGRWFNAFTTPQNGTTPICRFYLPPAHGDSHFYGRGADECGKTAAGNPGFVLEDASFMHMYMPVGGTCPSGTTPVYRLYSNRADTNHRYVTDAATRTQMQVRGWLAEGDGPEAVTMCAPD
ncbi:MAG: hypothetical protein U1F54_03175 [Burkholderiales bacterium]